MLRPNYTSQFKKDYKNLKKSGKNITDLEDVMKKLIHKKSLPSQFNDHSLHGELQDFRGCHIKSDLLLIYCKDKNSITFVRTGSHYELFS